jgi:hypothetical protein
MSWRSSRRGLSTTRQRAGISGEGRLGVKAIPAKEGRKLDQVGELAEEVRKRWAAGIWAGWSGRGEFRRGARGEFGVARRKKEIRRGCRDLGRVL